MTTQQRENMSAWFLNALLILATAMITGAITWGANNQRIVYVERELQDIRPVLMRIDRALSSIEQQSRDFHRRIDRLEK